MAAMKCLASFVVLLALASAGAEARGAAPHEGASMLAELEFRAGSARLPEAGGGQLARIAAWAAENFDGLVVVDGHADARGPAAGDVRLSLERAKLVRDQLVALGVNPHQIIVSAFGAEDRPRARVTIWGTRDHYQARRSRVRRR